MSDALSGLEPKAVWQNFAALAAIPRPSKHEEAVRAWVRSIAERAGWEIRADDAGNLVLAVPASRGRERAPIVVLQSHLDMVCEKNKDVEHDCFKDPIRPRIDGEWVRAQGTTLGADNGIGVAAALAVAADPTAIHGPLELLFTIEEETGLTGAEKLDPQLLAGRMLVNLDSEEDGKLFVGCAGGADSSIHLEPRRTAAAPDGRALAIEVRGLRGGHSGLQIHEGRGNAIKLLTRTLLSAVESGLPLSLAELSGGSKPNAIPREADALVVLTGSEAVRLERMLEGLVEVFRGELAGIDDGLKLRARAVAAPGEVLVTEDRDRLLRLLAALPDGVHGLSREIPGLVETSSNLAIIEQAPGGLRIVVSSRSSIDSAKQAVLQSVRSIALLAGTRVVTRDGYPGWQPDLSSPLLARARRVLARFYGAEPIVTAVHAGLECGLLGRKVPGLDMISFGPQIEGAHSPDERVHVASVARFWTALRGLLDDLAQPA